MITLDASSRIGDLVPIECDGRQLRAYVPRDLPFDPPPQKGPMLQSLLQDAYLVLGRLDGAASILPDRDRMLYMYLRKEAVLSSQIEGTQSSLEDFLRYEEAEVLPAPSPRRSAVRELLNYVPALEFGLEQLSAGSFSVELLETLHAKLLAGGNPSTKHGQIRSEQNFIGGKQGLAFIPPPPEQVRAKLENLVAYLNDPAIQEPALIRAAVAHAQFETIHPFMDGNGRLGRMLIALIICRWGVLRWPLLFLSLYFKQHRADYYELLNDTREHGDWESWLAFFLTSVITAAQTAAQNAVAISELLAADRAITANRGGSVIQVYEELVLHPLVNASTMQTLAWLSGPTVRRALEDLCSVGICSEITGRQRGRVYRYDAYLNLLSAGTEIE